jgi:hypothetical protein
VAEAARVLLLVAQQVLAVAVLVELIPALPAWLTQEAVAVELPQQVDQA